MRKIIYAENVSLDGYIEDREGKIDWTAPSEELHRHFNEREQKMDTHLYGRKVYEIMQYWEDADQDPDNPDYMKEYARRWQQQKKIVFSTTLNQVKVGYELRSSINPGEIRQWKRSAGKSMMVGGASLASSFIRLGLVDEVHLYILPLLLGGGKPMFSSGKKKPAIYGKPEVPVRRGDAKISTRKLTLWVILKIAKPTPTIFPASIRFSIILKTTSTRIFHWMS